MEPDNLNSKLNAWRPDLPIPSRFQAEVWQRIAAREEARHDSAWNLLREGLFTHLARPQYATALIAISISAALGVAHLQAKEANAKHWRQLESRYVNSITPAPSA